MGSNRFALGIALRAFVIGGLAVLSLELLLRTPLAASALVAAGLAALALGELIRHLGAVDRTVAQLVDGIGVGQASLPTSRPLRRVAAALRRASARIDREGLKREQRNDYLQTLIDNVSAGLFAAREGEALQPINRTALRMLGFGGLISAAPLPDEVAIPLQTLSAGQQRIVPWTDGRRMLACAAEWRAERTKMKLISLQPVDPTLDAVEIKAWQDLVRILSHEMMNSLTPITTLSASIQPILGELAGSDPRSADLSLAIDSIHRRSQGLVRFIEGYRALADAPLPSLRPVRVDEIIGRIGRLMADDMQVKGITFHFALIGPGLMINADSDLLEQALLNLLLNAVDAVADVAEPAIELRATAAEGTILLTVSDNGSGLPPAIADKIFVPFFTTKRGGSGIGLPLVKQIVLVHGGQISVGSSQPQGTEVTLSLPLFHPAATITSPGNG